MAKDVPATEGEFYIYCGKNGPHRSEELVDSLVKAKEAAAAELSAPAPQPGR